MLLSADVQHPKPRMIKGWRAPFATARGKCRNTAATKFGIRKLSNFCGWKPHDEAFEQLSFTTPTGACKFILVAAGVGEDFATSAWPPNGCNMLENNRLPLARFALAFSSPYECLNNLMILLVDSSEAYNGVSKQQLAYSVGNVKSKQW